MYMNNSLLPLTRHLVGLDFDRLNRLIDTADNFPPYNIEIVGENAYRIVLAVAGVKEDDLTITAEGQSLVIRGETKDDEARRYLYRGIANRKFERRFELADHVQVVDAKLENGLLVVNLVKEIPDALKPRQIAIQRA
jgi:molecular chaperone IbpA